MTTTDRHTYECAQCSPTSVGLAQAHPNQFFQYHGVLYSNQVTHKRHTMHTFVCLFPIVFSWWFLITGLDCVVDCCTGDGRHDCV